MKIHLIGICGTGMASLAGMLKELGHEVTGSDQNVYPPMSTQLEKLGIPVQAPYDAAHLASSPNLVIIGNAISRGNVEAEEVLAKNIPYLSMPEALKKFFLQDKTPLVVAGTHGKTTTSSMLAWVLEAAGKDVSFFIGGLPKNFGNNYKLGAGPYFVLEGDEYDTAFFDKGPKFLHYKPQHVLLTGVEFDHADIYRDLEHIKDSFRKLLGVISPGGTLVANWDCAVVRELMRDYPNPCLCYTIQHEHANMADYFAELNPDSSFSLVGPDGIKRRCQWQMTGRHNMSNALGVVALCHLLGLSLEQIIAGLSSFQGVKRRQDILGEPGGITVIDDFAHHPTAVRETIAAIANKYPTRRLWAIFEPRSNSSKRNIFQKEYSEAFAGASKVIIADVFMPEKVKDGQVLDVDQIVASINKQSRLEKARHISGVDQIVSTLKQETKKSDVLLVMSNGGFGGIYQKLLDTL